jgi:hypothetical protein
MLPREYRHVNATERILRREMIYIDETVRTINFHHRIRARCSSEIYNLVQSSSQVELRRFALFVYFD